MLVDEAQAFALPLGEQGDGIGLNLTACRHGATINDGNCFPSTLTHKKA